MGLFAKCAAAVLVMAAAHFISGTKNYYIAALALSFPGLSMLAYYVMCVEQGAAKVRATTSFALLATVPFTVFLLTLNASLKRCGIIPSLALSGFVWIVLSLCAVLAWNCTRQG